MGIIHNLIVQHFIMFSLKQYILILKKIYVDYYYPKLNVYIYYIYKYELVNIK